jgi:GMP synthase (glutamine-hydrolysing)
MPKTLDNTVRECPVIILDFGSQFTQLICREVRAQGIYCEIEPYSISPQRLRARAPKAIILSGSPMSVSAKKSPKLGQTVLELGVPVLGICYGMQLFSHARAARVQSGTSREYGFCEIEILSNQGVFADFKKGTKAIVWMSHGDSVATVPEGATLTAKSERCPVVGYQLGNFHGVQFHPEVAHTQIGRQIISNFLFRVCAFKADWKMDNFFDIKAREILESVGKGEEVIGAVSGGVDSTLLAVFLGRVLGSRFHPILVDNGLLRHKEAEEVLKFLKSIGVKLRVIDARQFFLKRLARVTDPERKRKIIGKAFIDVFEKELRKYPKAKFLAQGTLYPDVIESVSVKGPSHTIKTHHNVGGLPKRMKLKLIEPFRELFKDEVRDLGRKMGVPDDILLRHPFPGPGLAVRILGSITDDRLELLRKADAIFTEELKLQKIYQEIWQAFTVLLPIKAVGVMGDARTYESVVSLRAVTSRDGMTADWYPFEKQVLGRVANRIINEVPGINRVVYDISSKPPATIEWE